MLTPSPEVKCLYLILLLYRIQDKDMFADETIKDTSQFTYFINLNFNGMKTLKVFVFLILVILVSSCSKDLVFNQPDQISDQENSLKCAPLQMKIAVMSDIHYLDPSLLLNGAAVGKAFLTYLNYDPKLIEFSDPHFKESDIRNCCRKA